MYNRAVFVEDVVSHYEYKNKRLKKEHKKQKQIFLILRNIVEYFSLRL